MMTIRKLAELVRKRNLIDEEISQVIGRPAHIGHVGEFLASEIFGVNLEASASHPVWDGQFTEGPFGGKTVDVKFYAKREGLLDIGAEAQPDYFLVFAGPKVPASGSKGATRPWIIEEVFLFGAKALAERLRARGVKLGVATSVRNEEWEAARIYPPGSGSPLRLSNDQQKALSLFRGK